MELLLVTRQLPPYNSGIAANAAESLMHDLFQRALFLEHLIKVAYEHIGPLYELTAMHHVYSMSFAPPERSPMLDIGSISDHSRVHTAVAKQLQDLAQSYSDQVVEAWHAILRIPDYLTRVFLLAMFRNNIRVRSADEALTVWKTVPMLTTAATNYESGALGFDDIVQEMDLCDMNARDTVDWIEREVSFHDLSEKARAARHFTYTARDALRSVAHLFGDKQESAVLKARIAEAGVPEQEVEKWFRLLSHVECRSLFWFRRTADGRARVDINQTFLTLASGPDQPDGWWRLLMLFESWRGSLDDMRLPTCPFRGWSVELDGLRALLGGIELEMRSRRTVVCDETCPIRIMLGVRGPCSR